MYACEEGPGISSPFKATHVMNRVHTCSSLTDGYRDGDRMQKDSTVQPLHAVPSMGAVCIHDWLSPVGLLFRPPDQHFLILLFALPLLETAAIGELISQQLVRRHGLSLEAARARCFYIDSKGLVCAARRQELQHHKLPFAHDR